MEYQIDIVYLDFENSFGLIEFVDTLLENQWQKVFLSLHLDNIDSPISSETNVSVSYDHDFGHQITMSMRLMSKYLPQGSFNCWFRKHFHN